jgi:hypothetical protein
MEDQLMVGDTRKDWGYLQLCIQRGYNLTDHLRIGDCQLMNVTEFVSRLRIRIEFQNLDPRRAGKA